MIGPKIRQIRLGKGMTLNELAEKTETTAGYISQLERDIIDPSLSALRKIAAVLEVPIFTFLDNQDKQTAVIYANKRQKMELPDTNVVYEFLTPMASNQESGPKMVMFYYQLNPGCWSSEESLLHNAEECIYALKGSLEVLVGETKYCLDEGDSIYIRENTPHNIYNPGTKKAIGISAISPSIFISTMRP